MDAIPLFQWICGQGAAPPAPPCGDRALLRLLLHHRLLPRFGARIRREPPPWCGPRLREAVRLREVEAGERLRRDLDALRELSAAADAGPLVVVKGATAYALTGDPALLSLSADVDLLCADPEGLCAAARARGFHETRSAGPPFWRARGPGGNGDARAGPTWPHDLAELTRDGVCLEVHRHYPVLSYPAGVDGADLAPARSPRGWAQRFGEVTAAEMRHEHLLPHSVPGGVPGTGDLRFAGPAASVLVLCAHELRGSLRPPGHPGSGVRFGTLANIFDLAHHPGFDRAEFAALVDAFAGHDSVRFAGSLLERWFGSDPLRAGAPARGEPYPRLVSWFGGWAALSTARELLFVPGLETSVRRLGAEPVAGPGARGTVRVDAGADAAPEEGPRGPRWIGQLAPGARLTFDLDVRWAPDGLRLDVCLPPPRGGAGELQHVHVCGEPFDAVQTGVHVGPGAAWEPFGAGAVEVTPGAGGRTVRLTLPWTRLAVLRRGRGPFRLMLVVVRGNTADPSANLDPDAVVAVPLRVSPPSVGRRLLPTP